LRDYPSNRLVLGCWPGTFPFREISVKWRKQNKAKNIHRMFRVMCSALPHKKKKKKKKKNYQAERCGFISEIFHFQLKVLA
jgi:hypothetical protein